MELDQERLWLEQAKVMGFDMLSMAFSAFLEKPLPHSTKLVKFRTGHGACTEDPVIESAAGRGCKTQRIHHV